jgi:hypothetical protein
MLSNSEYQENNTDKSENTNVNTDNETTNENDNENENEYKVSIRDKIELLTSGEQKEIFRIFRKYDIEYSENSNGIFINLISVNSSILREVENYITHLLVIEKEITNIENQKNEIKNNFY